MKINYYPSIPFDENEKTKTARYQVFLQKIKHLEIQLRASEINGDKITVNEFKDMLRKSKAGYKRGLGDIYCKLFLKNNIVGFNSSKNIVWRNNINNDEILKKCYILQHDYAKGINEKVKAKLNTESIEHTEKTDDQDLIKSMIEAEVRKQLSNFFSSFK